MEGLVMEILCNQLSTFIDLKIVEQKIVMVTTDQLRAKNFQNIRKAMMV